MILFNMKIKAVIFDVGGILINENANEVRDFIASKYGFDSGDFWEYWKKNLPYSYCGELDALDFFEGLILELGIKNASVEDLARDWLEVRRRNSSLNGDVADIVLGLRGKFLLGILSNSTKLNELVEVRRDCYKMFDFVILSCDIGVAKPDRGIYEILIGDLSKRGIEGDEIVFVDDNDENLAVAKEFGMETILFRDAGGLRQDLGRVGVVV